MRRPLLVAGALFILGEIAVHEIPENIYYSAGLTLSAVLIAYISNRRMHESHKSINLLLFLCFISGAFWGYSYYHLGRNEIEKMLEGCVSQEERVRLNLYVSDINKTASGSKMLLKKDSGFMKEPVFFISYVQTEPDELMNSGIEIGRSVSIEGCISHIEGSTNPGQFDMKYYYMGEGVRYQIKCTQINSSSERVNYIILYLMRIRRYAADIIDKCYAPEDAGIIKTMLLGIRDDISDETTILFQRNGVAHILAISGLHIALLSSFIESLMKLMSVSKRKSKILVILILILYGIMTGFSHATVRAVLMLGISKLAFVFRRTPDLPTSMMEALLIMIMISPDSIFSTGMLMSYAAVLGVWTESIFYNTVFMRERFDKAPERVRPVIKKLIGSVVLSVSIELWMTPILMMTMYEVPLFSLVVNLLVTGLLTVLLCCAFVVIIIGGVNTFVIKPFVYISARILWCYRKLCRQMLNFPFSVIVTGHIEVWQVVIMYAVIITFLLICYRFMQRKTAIESLTGRYYLKWKMKLMVFYVFMCIALSFGMTFYGKLYSLHKNQIVFLDVGQGDGSIIRSKNGRNYIVDCGSSSKNSVGRYTLIPALKYYGMEHVDAVFISHTDTDHVSGIIELVNSQILQGIDVRKVIIADGTVENDNLKKLESEYIIEAKKGELIDGCFEVIYPSGGEEKIDKNDMSLVLLYKENDVEVLYTGDISGEVEGRIDDTLKNRDRAKLRILKCPHHGSRYSSTEDFLETYKPDVTVISVGQNNYGHPTREAMERIKRTGSVIYRTDEKGAVIIRE